MSTEIKIKFKGIDSWNRPVFKVTEGKYEPFYFGDVNKLWANEDPKDIIEYYKNNINALEYFGQSFGCEPHGGLNPNINLIIVE